MKAARGRVLVDRGKVTFHREGGFGGGIARAKVDPQVAGVPALDPRAAVAPVEVEIPTAIRLVNQVVDDAVLAVLPSLGAKLQPPARLRHRRLALRMDAVKGNDAAAITVEDGIGAVAAINAIGVISLSAFEVVITAAPS